MILDLLKWLEDISASCVDRYLADSESFLIVRPGPPDEDLDVVRLDGGLELLQGAHNALERRSHVGEVGDPASDDENLSFCVDFPEEYVVKSLNLIYPCK